MTENTNQEKQTAPAPKGGMSDFRKALLWTAIPIIVLSTISAGGTIARVGWADFGAIAGVAAVGLWGVAILAAIGFAVARKRQVAAGILVGVGIGIIGLGATCFAALSAI